MAAKRPRANLREPIVDVAMKLLRENGVKAVTQSRVARAAGIPQGHLTYYFPRRSDLLAAVAHRSVESGAAEVTKLLASQGWPRAGTDVRQQALDIVGFLLKDTERTRMLVGLLVESEEDPALRDMLLDNVRLVRAVIAAWLRRAPDDPDVELGLATLWGLGLMHLVWGDRRQDGGTDRLLARLPHWLALFDAAAAKPEGGGSSGV